MKNFFHKNAYLLAGVLVLSGLLFYWLAKPSTNEEVNTGFAFSDEKTRSILMDDLEVLGFADTLAAQKQAFSEALATFEKGKYNDAATAFKSFLEEYPQHQKANYFLGLSQLHQGNKTAAGKLLAPLSADPDFAFQEDAQWFSLLANADVSESSTLLDLQKIASAMDHKYQAPASALLASLTLNKGTFTVQNNKATKGQFAIIVQAKTAWWQRPLFRSSMLLFLPIGGFSLLFWKRRIKDLHKEVIDEEVAIRTAQLKLEKENIEKEKEISEAILNNILPAETTAELKKHGQSNTKLHEDVTVLFCDFQGFTGISEKLPPQELVACLGECFGAFDKIMTEENLEKIKTVGDCYICAGGLKNNDDGNPVRVVNTAIKMMEFLKGYNIAMVKKGKPEFIARIGINTGQVVAGIVGIKKYAYDIWGDTVNLAARMEQHSESGRINISESTHALVKDHFNCHDRGKVEAKGKGAINMYFIDF